MKWKIACSAAVSLLFLAMTATARAQSVAWVQKGGKPGCACECKIVVAKAGQGHCQSQCQGQCKGQCQVHCQSPCQGHCSGHGGGFRPACCGHCGGHGPGAEFQRGFHLGYIQGFLAGCCGGGPGRPAMHGGHAGCCGGQMKAVAGGCQCNSRPKATCCGQCQSKPTACCGQCKSKATGGCQCTNKTKRTTGFTYGWSSQPPTGCKCGQRVVVQQQRQLKSVCKVVPGGIAVRIEPGQSCSCGKKAPAPKAGCGCGQKKAAAPRAGCRCGQKKAAAPKAGCGCGKKIAVAIQSGCRCGQKKAAAPGSGCGCGQKKAGATRSGCGCGQKRAVAPKSGCKCGNVKIESVRILKSPVQLRLRGKLDPSTLERVKKIELRRSAIKKDVGCEKCRAKHMKDLTKVNEECLECLERKLLSDGELAVGILVPEKPKPRPKATARSL